MQQAQGRQILVIDLSSLVSRLSLAPATMPFFHPHVKLASNKITDNVGVFAEPVERTFAGQVVQWIDVLKNV